jgi:flagellar basal body-associated protein FliL
MNTSQLNPVRLRLILAVLLLLLTAATVGVFMVGYNQIKTHAQSAQEVAAKAQASQSSLENLRTTKKLLENNKTAVARADQLVSESKSYVYQDQIINDINRFASEAGLSITNITFTDAKTTQVSAPTTTATGGATPPTLSTATAAPAGVKSMTATVTLKNPVNYDNMLTFIHLLEESLFRVQISQIGLSRSTDENKADGVSSDVLTIEVYVR